MCAAAAAAAGWRVAAAAAGVRAGREPFAVSGRRAGARGRAPRRRAARASDSAGPGRGGRVAGSAAPPPLIMGFERLPTAAALVVKVLDWLKARALLAKPACVCVEVGMWAAGEAAGAVTPLPAGSRCRKPGMTWLHCGNCAGMLYERCRDVRALLYARFVATMAPPPRSTHHAAASAAGVRRVPAGARQCCRLAAPDVCTAQHQALGLVVHRADLVAREIGAAAQAVAAPGHLVRVSGVRRGGAGRPGGAWVSSMRLQAAWAGHCGWPHAAHTAGVSCCTAALKVRGHHALRVTGRATPMAKPVPVNVPPPLTWQPSLSRRTDEKCWGSMVLSGVWPFIAGDPSPGVLITTRLRELLGCRQRIAAIGLGVCESRQNRRGLACIGCQCVEGCHSHNATHAQHGTLAGGGFAPPPHRRLDDGGGIPARTHTQANCTSWQAHRAGSIVTHRATVVQSPVVQNTPTLATACRHASQGQQAGRCALSGWCSHTASSVMPALHSTACCRDSVAASSPELHVDCWSAQSNPH
jgi:hypothetical protein